MRPAVAIEELPSTASSASLPADSARKAAPTRGWLEFASYLARKCAIKGDLLSAPHAAVGSRADKKLRELWELTDLSASDFADEVAHFYELPRADLPQLIAASPLTSRFSARFLRQNAVFPCQVDGANTLIVADPSDGAAIRAAHLVLGGPVALRVCSFEDVETALSQRLGDDAPQSQPVVATPAESANDIESLRDLASGAPVVRAVNELLEKAVELRATDIHIEPLRSGLTVRMRIDGLLRDVPSAPDVLPQALLSRIKILSGLNIAERRLPQDGAARLQVSRTTLDVRVATVPTQYGESAVIRLLPKDRGVLDIAKLGLSAPDEAKLKRLLALPHGKIVVTGPTGSGKTTTLATMLTVLNDKTRKILTVEDPVEYELPGVNQSQVKPAIGFTFATALRAFVRQDPDVIMVGEVRDSETAHVAVHAALTGHLVLTTLHTENAAAAVPRLLDLGVEDFLLRSTLRAVIAQRLVRRLCERCRSKKMLRKADFSADPRYAAVGFDVGDEIHEPAGCESCGGAGYRGRVGIFEVLELTPEIRPLIQGTTDAAVIDRAAIQ